MTDSSMQVVECPPSEPMNDAEIEAAVWAELSHDKESGT